MTGQSALSRLTALCLATSALTAHAAVIDYPNGFTRATPIVLTDNSTQLQVLTGSATQSGDISETGGSHSLEKIGSGLLTLSGNNTYSGPTIITSGTLRVTGGAGSNGIGDLSDVTIASGATLDIPTFETVGSLSGAGSVTSGRIYAGGNNNSTTFSGTISGNGGTAGAILGSVTDNGTLAFNRSDAVVFGGVVSGSGSLTQMGPGTLTLTAAETYGGGTTVSGGTLQLGAGGSLAATGALTVNGGTFDLNGHTQTVGALSGTGGTIALGSGNLTTNSSASTTSASAITGTGTLTKAGAGMLTLSGGNTYTGATTVAGGVLNVTGSIASAVTVQNGATLAGSGKVGVTSVAAGGTLSPGAPGTPGTLTVNGNLTLSSGAAYQETVTAPAASLASVAGSASINGALTASLASGPYAAGQRYTILTASNGINGTFASFTATNVPGYVTARVSYDANNVYLNLDPIALARSLPANATANQNRLVAGIDKAVANGTAPPGGFPALYGLSGAALQSALDQISGQAAPNTGAAVGESFFSFLSMTGGGGSGMAGSYAPGSAYDGADAPHRAQLSGGEIRVWGGAYGGHVGISGDAASGAASLSSSNVGFIGGADFQVNDMLRVGGTLGVGHQDFRSGNGTGGSNDVDLGLNGRATFDAAYVAAAFGVSWHDITTQRVVTVSGTDILQGHQNANAYGGRIEAGWRTPLGDRAALTPYAAFAAQSFDSPAYAETVVSGASTFALSYAVHSSTLSRSELGVHAGGSTDMDDGQVLIDTHVAWAHRRSALGPGQLPEPRRRQLPGRGSPCRRRWRAVGRGRGIPLGAGLLPRCPGRNAAGDRHHHCRRHGQAGMALVTRRLPV